MIVDDYERADSAVSLGNAVTGEPWVVRPWAPHNGIGAGSPVAQAPSVLGISGGRAYSTDASRLQIATIDHGTSDVDVTLTLALPFPRGEGAGMIVRWAGPTEFYEVVAYHGITSGDYAVLLRRVDGPASWADLLLGFGAPVLAHDGAAGLHDFRIRAVGPTWSFGWDGNDVGGFVDGDYLGATDHGIAQYFTTAPIIAAFNGSAISGGLRVGALAL